MVKPEDSDQAIDLNAELDSSVRCSICLDMVSYDGERSRAKLLCGHEFHLDCIGSSFNMKGMMQCPNCRKIEDGEWLYPSGSSNSAQESSDRAIDNYSLYFSFVETPYGVHICPFRGLTHVHPSWGSSLGLVSTLTPSITHQHLGSSSQPHGWIQYQHAAYHHQQSSGPPVPISGGAGRFDTPRNLPRLVPSGRVYNPNPAFCLYIENSSLNYFYAWGRDNLPHFP